MISYTHYRRKEVICQDRNVGGGENSRIFGELFRHFFEIFIPNMRFLGSGRQNFAIFVFDSIISKSLLPYTKTEKPSKKKAKNYQFIKINL